MNTSHGRKYDIIVDESSNKPGEQAFEVSPGLHLNHAVQRLSDEIRNSSLGDIWGKFFD